MEAWNSFKGLHISQVPIRSSQKGKSSAKQCQESGTELLNRGGFDPLWALAWRVRKGFQPNIFLTEICILRLTPTNLHMHLSVSMHACK